jgi:hypothetical protein
MYRSMSWAGVILLIFGGLVAYQDKGESLMAAIMFVSAGFVAWTDLTTKVDS